MSRSSFTRPVVITSCLVALATLFAPPANAQRKKAPGSSAAAPSPKKKKAVVPAVPPPAEVAPAEPAAPPVAEEAAPAPAPAPAPPPPPVKRAAPPPPAEEPITDLGAPPQRSVRKKRLTGSSRSADVDPVEEEEEDRPVARGRKVGSSPPARRLRRNPDANAEAEEDRAAEGNDKDKDKDSDKSDDDAEAPVADAEPEPDSDQDTDVQASKHPRVKPPLLEIGAALRAFQRHFSYADDPNNELPNYDLGGAPALGIDVGVYPFKNAKGSLSGGFVGGFEYALALGTTYKVPTSDQAGTHNTSAYQYSVGVRGNYSFGEWLGNTVSAGVDYGAQSFVVDHPPPIRGNANIPGVDYRFLRPNVMGRFVATGNLSILGSLGYLSVMSAGEIVSADYFRGSTSSASGLDLGVGVAYEMKMNPKGTLKFLELRPMLTFRRYAFKFSPAQDDPYQSSGATDSYLGINLGVATRL